jgi:excisionase family DNA binding protein
MFNTAGGAGPLTWAVLRSAGMADTVIAMTAYDRADWFSPERAGPLLGMSGQTVRRWIREGRITAVRTPSGRFLIHRDAIAAAQPKPVQT